MMKGKEIHILAFFSLTFGILLSVEAQRPNMKQVSLLKGREDYTVNSVYQDTNGLIWFGTSRGLFRYDGINLDRFTAGDSLAGEEVTAISSDHSGILWIGHRNGKISLVENSRILKFNPEAGLGNVSVTDIVTDSSGNVWYSTLGEGIFKYNGRFLSNLNTDDGLSDDYVYDIEIDRNGTMWLATDYGITCLKDDSVSVISMKDGLPDNIVIALMADGGKKLWIATEEAGIAFLNLEDSSIKSFSGWDFGAITGFEFDQDNMLWISTRSEGLIRMDINPDYTEASYRQINASHGLASDRLKAVLRDHENNLWIAGNNGITQVLPPVFEFLNRASGAPFDKVYSIAQDGEGNYWICSESGLFKGIRAGYADIDWISISVKNNLENINFISIYIDSEGVIWAGTYGSGLITFDSEGRKIQNYTRKEGLLDENVIHISGHENLIWFSTLGGGVTCFNLDSRKMENFDDEVLNRAYVYASMDDGRGKIWMAGSFNAPAYIEDDKVRYAPINELSIQQLYGIVVDSAGSAWYNTINNGILCVTEDTILAYGKLQGINFQEIQSIIIDKKGLMVIIANEGIAFFKPGVGVIREYGETSGLSYLYPLLNAVNEDSGGRIWIGTESGLIIYNPDYLEYETNKPQIFLSSISLFGEPVEPGKTKFRYNQNNFTFDFVGIWFADPESLRYRYKLDGFDLDWTYTRRSQPFTYSKLPQGKYRFIVNVSIDGQSWTERENSSFAFVIKPPLWRRVWFIMIMVVLGIMGVYLYIRTRLLNLKKAKERLELEVQKRTEEIRGKNEELEKRKEEIESQRDMAEQQRDRIEHQNEEIRASIRYAWRIQSAALPPKAVVDETLGPHFILNKPRSIVSGDFYWVYRRDGHIFFAVADCTGHGVPGAFMSMLGLSALNDISKSLETFNAAGLLHLLSERIVESLHNRPGEERLSNDGMDISLCIYESATHTLQFAGVKNDLCMIRDGEMKIIRSDNVEIASEMAVKQKFKNNLMKLKRGDMLYLFSDGFPDQFGGPEGKKYKYRKFRELLMKIHGESMQKQKWLLDEEIEAWKGDMPQIDDIMVMGVRVE